MLYSRDTREACERAPRKSMPKHVLESVGRSCIHKISLLRLIYYLLALLLNGGYLALKILTELDTFYEDWSAIIILSHQLGVTRQ